MHVMIRQYLTALEEPEKALADAAGLLNNNESKHALMITRVIMRFVDLDGN